MKIYDANDYTWIQIDNGRNIIDMAIGNHYAGCRCGCTTHPLIKCDNFESCIKDILKQMKTSKLKDYNNVKSRLKGQKKYDTIFHKIESE